MTDHTEIISRITDRIQFLTGAEPASLVNDKPLKGQAFIDSLDLVEIACTLEEEFDVVELSSSPDWSIDKIVDAVIAARGAK